MTNYFEPGVQVVLAARAALATAKPGTGRGLGGNNQLALLIVSSIVIIVITILVLLLLIKYITCSSTASPLPPPLFLHVIATCPELVQLFARLFPGE